MGCNMIEEYRAMKKFVIRREAVSRSVRLFPPCVAGSNDVMPKSQPQLTPTNIKYTTHTGEFPHPEFLVTLFVRSHRSMGSRKEDF
jgi:hypothetical protein